MKKEYEWNPRSEPGAEYHGPTTLEGFVTWGRSYLRKDRTLPVVIWGPTGNGKSGFGLLLQRKLQGGVVDVKRQTAVGEADTIRLAKQLKRYEWARGDEGDKSGNKKATMHKENIEVDEEMDKLRKLNVGLILTRPNMADFMKGILDHVAWGFEIDRRGHFVAYEFFLVGAKRPTTIWVKRFEGLFPDAAKVLPVEWKEYIGMAMARSRDTDPGFTQMFERTVGWCRQVIRRVRRIEASGSK